MQVDGIPQWFTYVLKWHSSSFQSLAKYNFQLFFFSWHQGLKNIKPSHKQISYKWAYVYGPSSKLRTVTDSMPPAPSGMEALK